MEIYRNMEWAIKSHTEGAIEDATNGQYNLSYIDGSIERIFEQCDIRQDAKSFKQ